jgi:hypothetical protein
MADRPARSEAEPSETEEAIITPEMMAAGADALATRYLDLSMPELDLYPEIACKVYRAMVAVRT